MSRISRIFSHSKGWKICWWLGEGQEGARSRKAHLGFPWQSKLEEIKPEGDEEKVCQETANNVTMGAILCLNFLSLFI